MFFAIEESLQMPTPPKWILNLANSVTACLEPLEPMPPLGCHYHLCETGWEVSIFPSLTEIVGGPQDGRHVAPCFQVDILAVAQLFKQIDGVTWQSKSVDEGDQLGCHIAINGNFDGEAVSVRILNSAPACFDPGRKAFVHDGRLIETW
jgi:hypothetical protein